MKIVCLIAIKQIPLYASSRYCLTERCGNVCLLLDSFSPGPFWSS